MINALMNKDATQNSNQSEDKCASNPFDPGGNKRNKEKWGKISRWMHRESFNDQFLKSGHLLQSD